MSTDNQEALELESNQEAPADHTPVDPALYDQLEEKIQYHFKERRWLERALTHRSLQVKGHKSDYERLEFLGDAVLDLAIAHLLLDKHPEAREGDLSKMRAALVNTGSLAQVSRSLNLGPLIKLSRGEIANGGADRPSILADVFEALMGAIYREGGYAPAHATVRVLFSELISNVEPRDPKTELQEALHAKGQEAPVYLLECVEGPEHAPLFISIVQVNGVMLGRGRGNTKKASQQEAAAQALLQLVASEENV